MRGFGFIASGLMAASLSSAAIAQTIENSDPVLCAAIVACDSAFQVAYPYSLDIDCKAGYQRQCDHLAKVAAHNELLQAENAILRNDVVSLNNEVVSLKKQLVKAKRDLARSKRR